MFDLAIQGSVWTGELRTGCVYVSNGKIAKVSHDLTAPADTVIRLAEEQLLVPAATDLHVHLRDWEQSHKETVASGTLSALAGGVTTVAEMPNTDPRLDTRERVERRLGLLAEEGYVDYAIHAGVPESASELEGIRDAGAIALKFYPADLNRFDDLARSARRLGMKIAVHAEDPSMIGTREEPLAELASVRRLLPRLDRQMNIRFAHVSTYQAATLVRRKRREGYRLSLEVAPHHLFMTKRLSESRIGSASVVRPPLRDERTVGKMLSSFAHSGFDYFATDHAPHSKKEKFSRSPAAGFTGLDFAFAMLLTRSGLKIACRNYCERPARYLGVKKGIIRPSFEADMVVFSRRRWAVKPAAFVSKGRVTPFEGETLDFAVDIVIKGGTVVSRDGKLGRPPVRAILPQVKRAG